MPLGNTTRLFAPLVDSLQSSRPLDQNNGSNQSMNEAWRILVFSAFVPICAIGQQDSGDEPISLQTALWNLDVVHEHAISVEEQFGRDPKEIIQLPTQRDWSNGLFNEDMQEAVITVPLWFILDGSGPRQNAHFSVWCDGGKLYQDAIMVLDLEKAEGHAQVEWSFDGKSYSKSTWTQKQNFVLPPEEFDHDSFVRKYSQSKFLILKIKGEKGLVKSDSRKERKENYALVPLSLEGDKRELLKLINGCSKTSDKSVGGTETK